MGTVAEVFRWHYIHGGQKVGLHIQPYGFEEYVAFSIVPRLERDPPSGAVTTAVAQLTEGPTSSVHLVGVGRTLWVENQTAGPHSFISVGLMRFRQSPFD